MDWKDDDQLTNLPAFLKVGSQAATVYEDAVAKTTIKEALEAIVKGCGPSSEKYMAMFFSSKKKKAESMVAYGMKLKGYLKKGMPEANPATLLVQLKMQLNNQSTEKIRVLINTGKSC